MDGNTETNQPYHSWNRNHDYSYFTLNIPAFMPVKKQVKESDIPLVLPEFTRPPDAVDIALDKMLEMLSGK